MADTVDKFGTISDGLDRAQIHESPPVNGVTNARPPPETTHHEKHRFRRSVGEKLSTLIHPRRNLDRIKNSLHDGHTNSADQPGVQVDNDIPAPILAPNPPSDAKAMRLNHEVDEEPSIPPIKKLVREPVVTVKKFVADQSGTEFAENVGKSAVSHGASVNILRQEQKVEEASTEDQALAEMETLVQLKQLRQDEFVRWSVDRHVRKIGIMQGPGPPPQRPPLYGNQKVGSSQAQWGNYGKLLLQYWLEKYAQHYLDKAPQMKEPDHALLESSFERMVVASTPLQILFMEARDICHWEDPTKSAAYMAVYFFLVFYNQLASAAILYVLISTLYKRWQPSNLAEVRTRVMIGEDKEATARHLTELITQHGSRGWVDRAIDEAAAPLFYLCEHVADTLEMLQNAYEWRDPIRTTTSLCILFGALVLVAVAPTWLLVKLFLYSAGVMFFILTQLGRKFPRYRLLTSPFTWVMWKMPTHVDWAIARLQAEARQQLSQNEDPSSSHEPRAHNRNQLSGINNHNQPTEPQLIGIYTCKENGTPGRLLATTSSISFAVRGSRDPIWRMPFSELEAIHKIAEPSRTKAELGLLFVGRHDGPSHQVAGLEKRDEVFSQIVGYSGLAWKRIG